jgi:adenylate cyclase
MGRTSLLIGLVLLMGLVFIRVWDPYPVQAGRNFYFDSLQKINPRPFQDVGVRLVDIDEASLRKLGQWPWPRDIVADLVTQLQAYGAAIVVFDVLFAEADRYSPSNFLQRNALSDLSLPDGARKSLQQTDFDIQLAETFFHIPVVLGLARTPEFDQPTEAPLADVIEFGDNLIDALPGMGASTTIVPVLKNAAAGIGSVNVDPLGQANLVRTVPLVWNGSRGPVPSLALEALRVALGESALVLWGTEGSPGVIDAVGVGDIDIPTLPDGQIWVNFRRDNSEIFISAQSVLEKEYDADLSQTLEGSIVFVGTSAAGLLDIRATAIGQNIPGVAIQAQIVEQILLGTYLKRTDWIEGMEILALILLGAIVGYRMTLSGPVWSFLTGFVSAVLVVLVSWLSYKTYGVFFDATFPLVGGFMAFTTVAGYQFVITDMDKRQIRRSFAQFVAPTVLDQIEKSGYQLELGGVTQPVTVMFVDVRGFTTLSETMTATKLVALLNELFDKLSREILDQEGTIDKFIGDSVMSFWNAPIAVVDHAARACRSAIQMRSAIDAFNQGRSGPPIRIATGISTGSACVGNVGSRSRFDYSVIGDTVNVAARVEAACRHVDFDIVASENTIDMAQDLACLFAGNIDLKGKTNLTRVYIVLGDETLAQSESFKEVKYHHEALLTAIETGLGKETIEYQLLLCLENAQKLGLDLTGFYEKIRLRLPDFVPPR